MRTIIGYPPNIDLIRAVLPSIPHDALFCYGTNIYNPSGRTILPDQEFHEEVHSKQQEEIGIDNWWFLYLDDPTFRLEEEIHAYGAQFAFAKKHIEAQALEAKKQGKYLQAGKNNLIEYALESMAIALSGPGYGNICNYGQAVSKIRNYAKAKRETA